MASEHTPGPWYDDGYRIYAATLSSDPRDARVIVEYKHVPYFNDADRHLIAAAPDLLAALKGCEAVLGESAGSAYNVTRQLTDAELGKLWIAVTEDARAAIAKAEGRQVSTHA